MSITIRAPRPRVSFIRLIAGREVRQRLQSRAFRAATLLLAIGGFAVVMMPHWLGGQSSTPQVGIVATAPAPLRAALSDQWGAAAQIRSDPEAAIADVDQGHLDAAVLSDGTLAVSDRTSAVERATLADAVLRARLAAVAQAAGDQAVIAAEREPVSVRVLVTADHEWASASLLVLMAAILLGGGWVAGSVVEEKSGKLVELLLPAVRAEEILAGKVLGVGALTAIQVLTAGAGAALGWAVTGQPLPTGSQATIVLGAVWLLAGFFLYACAYAGAAALVSRQEDVAAVSAPMTLLLAAGYLVSAVAVSDPDALFVRWMSLLPPFAPLLMPTRAAVATVPWWEQGIALVGCVGTAVAVTMLAARIYRGAMLGGEQRTSVTAALRRSRHEPPRSEPAGSVAAPRPIQPQVKVSR